MDLWLDVGVVIVMFQIEMPSVYVLETCFMKSEEMMNI